MKYYLFIIFFIKIFCFNKKYNFIFKSQCNIDSYTIKKKITNEIDLINIISTFKYQKFSIFSQKNCVTKLPVAQKENDILAWFTKKERYIFTLMLTKCKKYLEFGMGGSTLLAYMTSNIEKIISVESDLKWINITRNFKNLKKEEGKRIILEYIDIGNISYWGRPLSNEKKNNFINYSKQVFIKYKNDYDLVFIDGKFRVACTLQTILNCKADTKIIIHDFNYLYYYHILYKYLDVIYSIDTLVIFSIKEDIDIEEIKLEYEKYKNDPR